MKHTTPLLWWSLSCGAEDDARTMDRDGAGSDTDLLESDIDTEGDLDTSVVSTGDTAAAASTGDTALECGDPQPFGTRHLLGNVNLDIAAEAIIEGLEFLDELGEEVAAPGDLTGDGWPDLVVGSEREANPQVYVFAGPVSGTLDPHTDAVTIRGPKAAFGNEGIAGVDGDGDGQLDLAVWGMGEVYVIPGPIVAGVDAELDSIAVIEHGVGLVADEGTLAPAGDVNGDGLEDLFYGLPHYGIDDEGVTYLLPAGSLSGGSLFPEDVALAEYHGTQWLSRMGAEVAARGDQDGDGVGDVLIGSPSDATGNGGEPPATGAFHVFDSSLTGWVDTTAATATLYSSTPDPYDLGAAVELADKGRLDFAGDVNGDGYDDMLAGEQMEIADEVGIGTTYVVYGPVSGVSDIADVAAAQVLGGIIDGSAYRTTYTARAGDLDADGFADFLTGRGKLWLFYGPGPVGVVEATIAHDAELDCSGCADLGYAMDAAGDIDGDCYPDFLLGGPGSYAPGGAAWLVLGGYL